VKSTNPKRQREGEGAGSQRGIELKGTVLSPSLALRVSVLLSSITKRLNLIHGH
jgi:hypothetical protein